MFASEVRARAVALLAACARANHRVRAGLPVDAGGVDDVATEGELLGRAVNLALVPTETHVEPLGDALVLSVADDALLSVARAP